MFAEVCKRLIRVQRPIVLIHLRELKEEMISLLCVSRTAASLKLSETLSVGKRRGCMRTMSRQSAGITGQSYRSRRAIDQLMHQVKVHLAFLILASDAGSTKNQRLSNEKAFAASANNKYKRGGKHGNITRQSAPEAEAGARDRRQVGSVRLPDQ